MDEKLEAGRCLDKAASTLSYKYSFPEMQWALSPSRHHQPYACQEQKNIIVIDKRLI